MRPTMRLTKELRRSQVEVLSIGPTGDAEPLARRAVPWSPHPIPAGIAKG